MRSTLLISFLAATFMFFNRPVPSQASPSGDAVTEMLKEFYTRYITEISKESPSEKKLNSIRKQYCTPGLLSRIREMELDYDPFLNAQDSDDSWVKTLTVSKDAQKTKGMYVVSFFDTRRDTKVTVRLLVIKDGEEYKIDGVTHQ